MGKLMIFGVLLLICLLLALLLVINCVIIAVKHLRHSKKGKTLSHVRFTALLLCALLLLCAGFTAITQWNASTPAITDEQGNPVNNSIAELIQVELNGRKEWISLRGYSANNPVLLFLAGGPGGTQMAAVRYDLAELEKHFVVVNWDQPGSGKSYSAMPLSKLTPETYIDDGYALTQYLCERFGQKKIYLVGESWGSALGIFLAAQHPELYHTVIGTGQMVAFAETERIDYTLAMELSKQAGDTDIAAKLEKNGPPPYYGSDVTWKSAVYLNYLSECMARNTQIHNAGYNTSRDLGAPEYGILDKINFFRGIVSTFNQVYPQLYPVDLRQGYTTLQIPVYFFLGRHDLNAPVSLAQEYFDALNAPYKEIVWFEHSGHSPWINESDKFVQEVIQVARNSSDK